VRKAAWAALGLAVLGLATLTAPATAQRSAMSSTTASCPAVPPPPHLPNGAVADAREMRAGDAAYQSWVSTAQPGLSCRRDAAQSLEAAARAAREDYNSAAGVVNTTTDAWRTQTTTFGARAHHNATPAPHRRGH